MEQIEFEAIEGSITTKSWTLSNPTSQRWTRIRSLFSNTAWTLKRIPIVEAFSSEEIEIQFSPLKLHSGNIEGKLMLQFPNGQSKEIRLLGKIMTSVRRRSHSFSIPIRSKHTKQFSISNTTASLQRFKTLIDNGSCPEAVAIRVCMYP